LAEEESTLLSSKEQIEKQIAELERQYQDIVQKYQTAIER
jgi:hypothetical protein